MNYFDIYSSNTLAGSANQMLFYSDSQPHRARIFYKVFAGGEYNYSFLFGNTTDSTFASGSESRRNTVTSGWSISDMAVSVCKELNVCGSFVPVTFCGKSEKCVNVNDRFFYTDPVKLFCKKNDFICVEFTYCGERLINHEESQISSFLFENGVWKPSKKMPFTLCVGCDRAVKQKIAFLGDSITQGIGVKPDSYKHVNALLADMLGTENAYYNLGIGYARGNDAATDGVWLERAKRSNIVCVCFGVNDMFQGHTVEDIKQSLKKIIDCLHCAGVRVLLQTVPPFDYGEEHRKMWLEINEYILFELSKSVEAVFDTVPVLGKEGETHKAKFGGHPNEAGCEAWAKAMYPILKNMLK